MARTVTYRGVEYPLPSRGDPNWDKNLNAFLAAVTTPDTVELVDADTDAAGVQHKVLFRSRGTRLEVCEDNRRWRRVVGSDSVRDIREYMTATEETNGDATNAMALISAELSAVPGTATQAKDGRIFVPLRPSGLWGISTTMSYIGANGVGLSFTGEHALCRGQASGSGFIWTGAAGGTMFDFKAINGSLFKDLVFSGGRLAKYLVRFRQYFDAVIGSSSLIPSSGVDLYRCYFCEPGSYSDSALVLAGADDNPPNQYQSDSYRFHQCTFQGLDTGSSSLQGYGFLALVNGNTKCFEFHEPTFTQLYQGVKGGSGDCNIYGPSVSNIGGYGRVGGAVVVWDGNTLNIYGGRMENSTAGWAARIATTGQQTACNVEGMYFSGNLPADDYAISTAGSLSCRNVRLLNNSRSTSTMNAWQASHAYATVGADVYNGTNAYRLITAGTSASSGGPTGTSADITDGSCHWKYMGSATANVCKLQADGAAQGANSWGGAIVENTSFGCNTTAVGATPLYDGSGNHIGGNSNNLFSDGGDYARGAGARVRLLGNCTGLFGGNIRTPLPDVDGWPHSILREQMWTDSIPSNLAGASVLRNDGGIFIISVPAANLNNSAGHDICQLPPFSVITRCIARVTVVFSGTGLSGTINLRMGVQYGADPATQYDDDGVLAAFDAKSATITKGKLAADYGAQFDPTIGYVGNDPGGYQDKLRAKVTVGAGSVSNLSGGTVIFYVEFKRLGI